jgi:hypothetical protein
MRLTASERMPEGSLAKPRRAGCNGPMNIPTLLLVATVLLTTCGDVRAQSIPIPRPKPETAAASGAVPVPRPKPGRPADPTDEPAPVPPAVWTETQVADALAACKTQLAGLDLAYEPIDRLGGPDGCGAAAPVELTRVADVDIVPPAKVTCSMARQLFLWVSQTVQPEAQSRLGTRVTAIRNAASYVCRGRNNQKGGKLSEHGRANALDMSGFSFGKTKEISIGDGWGETPVIGVSSKGSFLEAVRIGACKQFATVLGPGSDAYHGDHFHVDAIQRKNDYRICQ